MWRAFYQQILESFPTLEKLLILFLGERANFLSVLIHFRHWEKLIVKLTQQAFPRCNSPECVGIQPCPGSIVKRERKKSKVDQLLRKVLKFECGAYIFEFLYMAIRVFMIQAMKRR